MSCAVAQEWGKWPIRHLLLSWFVRTSHTRSRKLY